MSERTAQSARRGARRDTLRLVYVAIAMAVWIMTFAGRLRRKRFVVLCYHGVLDDQRERFASQMKRLAGRTETAAQFSVALVGRGRPRVVVTFDDAFSNLIPNALPSLKQYAIPVMIFAVTENLGDRPRWNMPEGHPERFVRVMTEEELRFVGAQDGVAIGSHTATHPRLDSIPKDQLEREVSDSRDRLISMLGINIVDLALPYGAWNADVIRVSKAAGYERVFTLVHQLEPSGVGDGVIGRFSVSPEMWPLEFRLAIDGAYGWLGGLRRVVSRVRGERLHGLNDGAPAEVAA